MGGTSSSPWRETRPFKEEAKHLRNELKAYRTTELKITLVGYTGDGKSSLINSIFAISKRRMANMTLAQSDIVEGVGTHYFTDVRAGEDDLFKAISFFDTMGFHSSGSDMGICDDDLKACLDGRLNVGHRFNKDNILKEALNRPHCVLVVVSADVLNQPSQRHFKKLKEVITFVPEDVARIVVITKVDKVCPDSGKNFEFIYKSKVVEGLVKKAQAILGVQENHVFPIINFVREMYINEEKSVPIMFLLKFAFDFAKDTKDK